MEIALLFISMIILIFLGMPIAFSLFSSCMVYLLMTGTPLAIVTQRFFAGSNSFALIAIPFFILAGNLMNTGGITKKIFSFANTLVGHIPGGLAHTNILASVFFAGMSGSAIADAGGLGAIEIKSMREQGYDDDLSIGVTGGSSIIGPIIPPSINAVIFAVTVDVSVGKLFVGGFLPGAVMAMALAIFVFIISKKRNYTCRKRATLREIFKEGKDSFFPLLTPVILLGGILTGVFTSTEAAIVAVVYALLLSVITKNITWRTFWEQLVCTAKTTTNVMMVVASASVLTWILTRAGFTNILSNFFLNFIDSKISALLIISVLLLLVGMILDPAAIIILLAPILTPIVMKYGVNPIHFGIVMVLNTGIGLLTPPVGMILYVLSDVAKIKFEKVVKAIIPYVLILAAVLIFITYVPDSVLFLIRLVYGDVN